MRIIAIFVFLSSVFSQKYRVDSIKINNQSGVKDFVVLRELLFQVADSITVSDIEISRKRIESLRLFNSVNCSHHIDSVNHRISINFEIFEKFNYNITPLVEFYKNQINKDSYGLFLGDKNFRNENIHFYVLYQDGFRDFFKISYRNPWIRGTDRLGYAINYSSSLDEDLEKENIFYRVREYELLLTKGFGPFFTFHSGVGKKRITFVYPLEKKLDLLNFQSGITFNNIADQRYPVKNVSISLFYNTKLDIKDGLNDYQDLLFKLNTFFPIHDFVYAFGMSAEHRFNEVPDRLLISFGEDNSIRGNNIFKKEIGRHLFIVRQEIRYLFFKDYQWSLDLPLVAKYLQKMNTSFYVFGFADIGRIYESTHDLFDIGHYKKGFGVGLGVLFPYLDNFSSFIGTNPKGKIEFGFTLGAKI